MEFFRYAVPAATAILGALKLLNLPGTAVRLVTTILIILSGGGSALLIRQAGEVERRRAERAEQAQARAEEKLDRMSDALLEIQHDLAELQLRLARAPQGSAGAAAVGSALKATLQKVNEAKQIVRPTAPPAENEPAPGPVSPAPPAATEQSPPTENR